MLGVYIVIKQRRCPHFGAVAGIALIAKVLVMVVVFDMAGNTRHFQRIRERVLAVAVVAAERGMTAVEHEICIPGMIKARIGP